MKVALIGGTGLIGSKTVAILRRDSHEGGRGAASCRPACFSLPRRTMSLPSSTKWPSQVAKRIIEVAGPERAPLRVGPYLASAGDNRP
ncbi:hypothetical protein BSZ19_14430 [Bradyrhizobium japonicum]|uniref:Uncharacterized protein n=1 Tax=Bradyrhizobium japonicum TaxID=375 RepID=A0A1Y2JR91_BRAJP|nr:hypothetical protein [Bradyrhizobium japonicum]OSJ33803.1 hypothetical protein BSZ19_14430 [Bradyrhizobium japonicum]